MNTTLASVRVLSVVKVGGGLLRLPHALERVCAAVETASKAHRLVVVPGGGPFADAVRDFQQAKGLSQDAAHWMAILAMDQYAFALADRMGNAIVVEEPGAVSDVARAGRVAVFAPARWIRSADVLPHSWEVTSDSIAAFIAGALGAVRLVLVKPTESGTLVDPYFTAVLPSGLSWVTMSVDRIEELSARLSESTAADESAAFPSVSG